MYIELAGLIGKESDIWNLGVQLSWLQSEESRKSSESNSHLESIQNELLNPFIQSRRNSITRSGIMQHNKSSVSSKSVKACWHREWLKLMGPYGEKACVNKPPCLPTREVCGSILWLQINLTPSKSIHWNVMQKIWMVVSLSRCSYEERLWM